MEQNTKSGEESEELFILAPYDQTESENRVARINECETDSSNVEETFQALEQGCWCSGRYQILVLLSMMACQMIPGMITFTSVFTTAAVPYNCSYEDIMHAQQRSWNHSCDSLYESEDSCFVTITDCSNTNTTKHVQCEFWTFDNSTFSSTIVTQFHLVCDSAYLRYVPNMCLFLGSAFGCIIFGIISDAYGRKVSMLISTTVITVFTCLVSQVNVFWLYVVLQVLIGAGVGGLPPVSYTYALEFTTTQSRSIFAFTIYNGLTLGILLFTLVAYLQSYYNLILLYAGLVTLALLPILCYLKESPRWLLSNKKTNQANKVFKLMKKFNGLQIELPMNISDGEFQTELRNNSNNRLFEYTRLLRRSHALRKVTLVTTLSFFTAVMTYYGISLSVGSLTGSTFVNQVISAVISVPARLTCMFIGDKVGRRCLLVVSFVASGLCLATASGLQILSMSIMQEHYETIMWGRTGAALLGKFVISITFNILYVYIPELLPTAHRTTGCGVGMAVGTVGALCSQAIQGMETKWTPLPYFTFAVGTFLAPFLLLLSPETVKRNLPQDLVEWELFIANH